MKVRQQWATALPASWASLTAAWCASSGVKSGLGKPSGPADAPPGALHVDPMRALTLAGKDERIARHLRDTREHLGRGGAQRHVLRAGFGVGQVQRAALKVDVVPAQGQDLGLAAAGEDQETHRGDHQRRLGAAPLRRGEHFAKAGELGAGQEALPAPLRVLVHEPARVGALIARSPRSFLTTSSLTASSERSRRWRQAAAAGLPAAPAPASPAWGWREDLCRLGSYELPWDL
jgi:hypothetical protein